MVLNSRCIDFKANSCDRGEESFQDEACECDNDDEDDDDGVVAGE